MGKKNARKARRKRAAKDRVEPAVADPRQDPVKPGGEEVKDDQEAAGTRRSSRLDVKARREHGDDVEDDDDDSFEDDTS